MAAPLIFSGDITRMDDFTLSLLTNDEIIEVDQDPLGIPGYRVKKDGELEVWKRVLEDGSIAVGLFNRGEKPASITANGQIWESTGKQRVRDLWRQKELGTSEGKFTAEAGRHGAVMIRMWPAK